MHIVLRYHFTDEQVAAFRQLADDMGGHQITHIPNRENIENPPDTEVILGHFNPAVCATAPSLKWIQSFSAGMDSMLFPDLIESDVIVTNMAGHYAVQGAEQAWALLLALCRGIDLSVEAKLRNEWQGGRGIVLTGGTLGVIGAGGFGQEIVTRAAGYDMSVVAIDPIRRDPPPGFDELSEASTANLHALLERSDAVMLACPRTVETYHLIGAEELRRMKSSAYLINVTRGGIVDEVALVQALESGEIAGAGLDVTEREPLPAESPLLGAPNLILTGHSAGRSQYREQVVFEFFTDNLKRYLKGDPLNNVVDKTRGF